MCHREGVNTTAVVPCRLLPPDYIGDAVTFEYTYSSVALCCLHPVELTIFVTGRDSEDSCSEYTYKILLLPCRTLLSPQCGVETFFSKQFFVTAVLADGTFFEHVDGVGMRDG